jgi:hypothetical protein
MRSIKELCFIRIGFMAFSMVGISGGPGANVSGGDEININKRLIFD